MKKVAVFGGSFNPVHIGHMILADFIRQEMAFDEVWFMLSPLNPLKANPGELLPDEVRLEMLHLAVDGSDGFKVSDIELSMPRPSYTVDTLRELRKRYPDVEFSLIVGGDNFASFDRWKCSDEILKMVRLIVYPRPGCELPDVTGDDVTVVKAPLVDISSTDIRRLIASGRSVNFLIPDKVYNYIRKHQLYKQ